MPVISEEQEKGRRRRVPWWGALLGVGALLLLAFFSPVVHEVAINAGSFGALGSWEDQSSWKAEWEDLPAGVTSPGLHFQVIPLLSGHVWSMALNHGKLHWLVDWRRK